MSEEELRKPANHWFHVPILLIGGGFWLRWHFHTPSSGKALLLLGALAALMMLVEMRPLHKALYVFLVFGLVLTENRAIDKDRRDTVLLESAQRTDENKQFQNIANALNDSISNSDREFSATMARVQEALDTSEATLRNTRPHADIEIESVVPPVAGPIPLVAGESVTLNVHFKNIGNENATSVKVEARIQIATIDDVEGQKQLDEEFTRWWKTEKHRVSPTPVQPGTPDLLTFSSRALTDEDVKGLFVEKTKTIYILTRVQYTDSTGNWMGDACREYVHPTIDMIVLHECLFHNNHRYPIQ